MKALTVAFVLVASFAGLAEAAIPPAGDSAPAVAEWEVPPARRPVRLPPFFWYERNDAERTGFLMVGMLLWQTRNPVRSSTLFVPLVFTRSYAADGGRLIVTPFFSAYTSPTRSWWGLLHILVRWEREEHGLYSERTLRILFVPVYRNRAPTASVVKEPAPE